MPFSPTLRRGNPRDLETIVNYNLAMAAETEDITLDPNTVRRGAKAVLRDPRRGFYLVVEVDGQVAGQLMITPEWSDWRDKWFWWIQSVYVAPDFRRRGIFARLFKETSRLARRRGDVAGIRLYVDEHNAGARKTYQALGMEESNYLMFETEW